MRRIDPGKNTRAESKNFERAGAMQHDRIHIEKIFRVGRNMFSSDPTQRTIDAQPQPNPLAIREVTRNES